MSPFTRACHLVHLSISFVVGVTGTNYSYIVQSQSLNILPHGFRGFLCSGVPLWITDWDLGSPHSIKNTTQKTAAMHLFVCKLLFCSHMCVMFVVLLF